MLEATEDDLYETDQPKQRDLYVNEIFGPTLQGEGPAIGEPAVFLRMAGCNLACVWCDTPYSWDWKRFDKAAESHRMTVAQVEAELFRLTAGRHHDPMLVVVSGGEPMLQQAALVPVFSARQPIWRVEVETAGTVRPSAPWAHVVSRFVVSPKLNHSLNPLDKRERPDALTALRDTGKAVWKFVCQQPSDLVEVQDFVDRYDLDNAAVYIMPEGTTPMVLEDHASQLAPHVIERGWRLTPRLHIALWGSRRAV